MISAAAKKWSKQCALPATVQARTARRKSVTQKHGTKRASQGLTGLTQNALKGIRQMPPHGGNPNLTDLEIERAITYMVNQSGGHWIEPIDRASPPVARGAEQVVQRPVRQVS